MPAWLLRALAWVSARCRRWRSAKAWPVRSMSASASASAVSRLVAAMILIDEMEQARDAHQRRPFPDFERAGAVGDREEDDIGTADQVLVRHKADGEAAIARIVAIVAHHE